MGNFFSCLCCVSPPEEESIIEGDNVPLSSLSKNEVYIVICNLSITLSDESYNTSSISGKGLSLAKNEEDLAMFNIILTKQDGMKLLSVIEIYNKHGVPKSMLIRHDTVNATSELTEESAEIPKEVRMTSTGNPVHSVVLEEDIEEETIVVQAKPSKGAGTKAAEEDAANTKAAQIAQRSVELGTVEDVIGALSQAAADPYDTVTAAAVLESIPRVIDGKAANHKALGMAAGVADNVVILMKNVMSSADLVLLVLIAVKTLCRYGTTFATSNEDNIKRLGAAGACEWLVNVMRVHKDVQKIAEVGCWAIRNICSNDENKCKSGDAGASELVTALLKTYKDDAKVAEAACFAICNLCTNDANDVRCAEAGACEVLASVLRTHQASAAVCEGACWAIRNLANGDEKNKSRCGGAGACEALVAVLQTHQAVSGVRKQACGALWNLCTHGDVNKELVGIAGGCEAIVQVLSSYDSEAPLVEQGCGAIRNLSALEAHRRKFGNMGACELLVRLIRKHELNVGALEQALAALSSLCTHDPDNRLKCGEVDACAVLHAVLKKHAKSASSVAVHCVYAISIVCNNCWENVSRFRALGTAALLASFGALPDMTEQSRERAVELATYLDEAKQHQTKRRRSTVMPPLG